MVALLWLYLHPEDQLDLVLCFHLTHFAQLPVSPLNSQISCVRVSVQLVGCAFRISTMEAKQIGGGKKKIIYPKNMKSEF